MKLHDQCNHCKAELKVYNSKFSIYMASVIKNRVNEKRLKVIFQ